MELTGLLGNLGAVKNNGIFVAILNNEVYNMHI